MEFLSLNGLENAPLGEKRSLSYPQFSDHYFTGEYPIKPHDNLKGIKVKQLSLLSGKSNINHDIQIILLFRKNSELFTTFDLFNFDGVFHYINNFSFNIKLL